MKNVGSLFLTIKNNCLTVFIAPCTGTANNIDLFKVELESTVRIIVSGAEHIFTKEELSTLIKKHASVYLGLRLIGKRLLRLAC